MTKQQACDGINELGLSVEDVIQGMFDTMESNEIIKLYKHLKDENSVNDDIDDLDVEIDLDADLTNDDFDNDDSDHY